MKSIFTSILLLSVVGLSAQPPRLPRPPRPVPLVLPVARPAVRAYLYAPLMVVLPPRAPARNYLRP